MWTLDTSVYVRAADPTDPDQATCQALIDALDAQAAPIIIPRLLLAEVAGALRRLTRDPIRARLAVDTLASMPHVELIALDDALNDAAAEIAADYALRGSDAIFVAVARQHNCTLVLLDREQRERAAAVVSTPRPPRRLPTSSRRRQHRSRLATSQGADWRLAR